MSTEIASLERIESMLEQLLEDVNAPPRHGEPGGLLVRQEKAEEAIERILETMEAIKRRLEAIEGAPGRAALTWWDRVGLALLGLVLTAIGGVIGAYLTKGRLG